MFLICDLKIYGHLLCWTKNNRIVISMKRGLSTLRAKDGDHSLIGYPGLKSLAYDDVIKGWSKIQRFTVIS